MVDKSTSRQFSVLFSKILFLILDTPCRKSSLLRILGIQAYCFPEFECLSLLRWVVRLQKKKSPWLQDLSLSARNSLRSCSRNVEFSSFKRNKTLEHSSATQPLQFRMVKLVTALRIYLYKKSARCSMFQSPGTEIINNGNYHRHYIIKTLLHRTCRRIKQLCFII